VPGRRQAVVPFLDDGRQPARALTFEVIQRQLKSVGIELVPRFQPAGLMFGTTLPSGDWDLIMFTWVEAPSSKITSKDKLACGGHQLRQLLQQEGVRAPRTEPRRSSTRTPHEAAEPGRGDDGEGRSVHPHVRSARLHHRCEVAEGPDDSDDGGRRLLEREHLVDVVTPIST
jgi:hypothetical protein